MPNDAAHSSYWHTADVVFGGPLLLALALQWFAPLALPQGRFRPVWVIAGVALIASGVVLIAAARRELARHHQPADPGRPTTALVSSGMFAVSRNPLYLGVACVLAGTGLAANIAWVLAALPPSLLACRALLIAPEERYLRARLGDEYSAYTARVRRWLGRAS